MILYQASLDLSVLKRYYKIFQEPLNVLLSMAIINGRIARRFLVNYRYMINKIVLDSGAWSVAMGKSNMKIGKLILHLKIWASKYDHYFNFDTDFNTNGFQNNIVNQMKMERAGLKPIPVVHNFFNNEIDYYLQSGKYPWLALGSKQTTSFRYLRLAVDRIKLGNPDIKIHWFGGSRYDWLIKTPVASCDTASWAKTGSYGYINYWNPKKSGLNKNDRLYVGGFIKDNDKTGHDYVTYNWRGDVDAYLKGNFGFTYQDLVGHKSAFNMQLVNVRFYAELERRINKERIKRGIALQ